MGSFSSLAALRMMALKNDPFLFVVPLLLLFVKNFILRIPSLSFEKGLVALADI